MDLNRVMIIGRVTQKPEKRVTQSGQTVTTFSVATNRRWRDSNGNQHEQAEFHNVVTWGKLAEICEQFLDKGRRVYVEGRLQTRSWEGQDGVKRYRTEIIASNVIMLDRSNSNSGNMNNNEDIVVEPVNDEVVEEEINLDNIPF